MFFPFSSLNCTIVKGHSCVTSLPDDWKNSDKLSFYTDAAGSLGFGAIFGDNWCYSKWPAYWTSKNIATLEFYPILSQPLRRSIEQSMCPIFH